MSYYELINPSDTYTLKAADATVAVLVAITLGSGRYGLQDEKGQEILPIFIIDGLEEWLQAQYDGSFNVLFGQADKAALAACFDSVAICSLKDRHLWELAVEAMDDPVKRAAWLAEWHDAKRSSMNDIGGRAKQYATRTRELAAAAVQP